MKIKETTYTTFDDTGRIVRQVREVDIIDPMIRGYDYGTRYGDCANPRCSSFSRIFEAIDDYRRSNEW